MPTDPLFHTSERHPRFDHPLLRSWCPEHGYFWSSCPGCVWEKHGDKFGMTLTAVKMQEIARVLEDRCTDGEDLARRIFAGTATAEDKARAAENMTGPKRD